MSKLPAPLILIHREPILRLKHSSLHFLFMCDDKPLKRQKSLIRIYSTEGSHLYIICTCPYPFRCIVTNTTTTTNKQKKKSNGPPFIFLHSGEIVIIGSKYSSQSLQRPSEKNLASYLLLTLIWNLLLIDVLIPCHPWISVPKQCSKWQPEYYCLSPDMTTTSLQQRFIPMVCGLFFSSLLTTLFPRSN